ncbi:MAG: hypothetical protein A3J93_02505 [Candidatus Magasanikbacteria bacterium RIFOXYC2_FULL_42_28]|uniref:Type 4 fimbrial biogenesis protein PilX N-terminal domain-containing protein n=1 Tax=Candidatus Magasanikbacteria bacterium RIFOXYC2_FULL_42_28 TaxID=1798704 RepID=A0A1F6NVS2_9BACT|nr:MAG: hypothetical protein A3J93_02505 [Candidatus Magasanikbacteria bacterium RIFOXYC2_FULL_42_28]
MLNIYKKLKFDKRGTALLFALIFGAISFSLIVVGVTGYAVLENRASVHKHNREMAFQIAEAGVNYYRWHLAHDKTDYQDGTGAVGPYIHEYEDKDGNVIGHYSLNIIPPQSGSTVVTIESTGWLDLQPDSKRTLKARVGFPALTDFAYLTNVDIWIGDSETANGKLHANGGARFDGIGNAPITSAVPTYICKQHHGCGNQEKPGVWGDGDESLWEFPVPAQDFSRVTAKLAEIKREAEINGIYLTSSGKQGYRLEFRADGKINIYKVNTTDCYYGQDYWGNGHARFGWFCIDAATFGTAVVYDMPTNGYIYVEDMVWVDGIVNGRATVGTADDKSIVINNNLTYLAKDGTNVLGLIAEKNILLPYIAPNYLEVDAAMLAQTGAAKRYFYMGNKRESLTIYGSIISNDLWTWSYVSGGGSVVSGYKNTYATYDANLTLNPPPGFPVGSEYFLVSWEEIE